jgi:hypothetical protein
MRRRKFIAFMSGKKLLLYRKKPMRHADKSAITSTSLRNKAL